MKAADPMTDPLYGSPERPTPTMEQYVKALQQAELKKDGKPRAMLKANFLAPEHTITATEMTRQVFDIPGHGTANMRYGALARKLAWGINITIPKEEQAVNFLVSFADVEGGKWIWTLHPNLVEALRRFHI